MKLINLLVCLVTPLALVAEGSSYLRKSQEYECVIKGVNLCYRPRRVLKVFILKTIAFFLQVQDLMM